jgi:hypothetical protein
MKVFIRLRALMPEDWWGSAGKRFRKTADAISDFC